MRPLLQGSLNSHLGGFFWVTSLWPGWGHLLATGLAESIPKAPNVSQSYSEDIHKKSRQSHSSHSSFSAQASKSSKTCSSWYSTSSCSMRVIPVTVVPLTSCFFRGFLRKPNFTFFQRGLDDNWSCLRHPNSTKWYIHHIKYASCVTHRPVLLCKIVA